MKLQLGPITLSESRSHSLEDNRRTHEEARHLLERGGNTMATATNDLLLSEKFLHEFLTYKKERAERSFEEKPIMKVLQEIIIPGMYNFIVSGSMHQITLGFFKMQELGLFANDDEKIGNLQKFDSEYGGLVSEEQRFASIRQFIANEFLPYGIYVHQVQQADQTSVIGMSSIVVEREIMHQGNSFYVAVGETLDPILTNPQATGFFDAGTETAFIDTLAIEQSAGEKDLRSYFLDRIFPATRKFYRQYCADKDEFCAKQFWDTATEEVKHGINYLRRKAMNLHLRRDGMQQFFHERLTAHSTLKILREKYRGTDIDVAIVIEEINAKLTVIAFGPDPRIKIAEIHDGARYMKGESTIRAYYAELEELLLSKGDRKVQNGIYSYLEADQAKMRLLAMSILEENFDENFDDVPFCKLSPEGKLVEHSGTHPMFTSCMGLTESDEAAPDHL